MKESPDFLTDLFGWNPRNQLLGFLSCMAIVVGIVFAVGACTENQRAKRWGGESSIDLPADTKLVTVTWKDVDLWYLVRPMRRGETAEDYRFAEESSWGVLEGTIVLKESKTVQR